MRYNSLLRKSFASGILIGVAVILNIMIDNQYVGAFLFSIALLTIIKNKLWLYTGQIGFALVKKFDSHSIKYKRPNPLELIIMCVTNIIGSAYIVILFALTNPYIYDALKTSTKVTNHTYLSIFLAGIGCGIMMYIAVTSKPYMIIMCVMAFILAKFEHCIADAGYFFYQECNVENVVKYLLIILGNSVGAIAMNLFFRETLK